LFHESKNSSISSQRRHRRGDHHGTWAPNVHPTSTSVSELADWSVITSSAPVSSDHAHLIIKNSVLEKDPWVAMSLFNAWQESKRSATNGSSGSACIKRHCGIARFGRKNRRPRRRSVCVGLSRTRTESTSCSNIATAKV
jgi:hypothetical protein